MPWKHQNFSLKVALILFFYELFVLFHHLIFTKLLVLHYHTISEIVKLVEDIVVDYVTNMVS